jgi:hypothetical protein
MTVIKAGSGFCDVYGVFSGRVTADVEVKVVGGGRYPIESKVEFENGRRVLVQKRFLEEV